MWYFVNNVGQYKNTHESRMTGKDWNFDIIHIDVLEWVSPPQCVYTLVKMIMFDLLTGIFPGVHVHK